MGVVPSLTILSTASVVALMLASANGETLREVTTATMYDQRNSEANKVNITLFISSAVDIVCVAT